MVTKSVPPRDAFVDFVERSARDLVRSVTYGTFGQRLPEPKAREVAAKVTAAMPKPQDKKP